MLKQPQQGKLYLRRRVWPIQGGGARVRKAASVEPREERQKVMIKARMRSGVSWHDVCILNLSVHGVGIQAAEPPARGTYVEIRRGSQVIVARVAWAKGHRAGLRSQDAIFIQAVVNDIGSAASAPRLIGGTPIERRSAPRTASQQDSSRLVGRAMEFACFGLVAAALAVTAFSSVEQALANPLSQISAALE
jgi:hypothetical protein